MRYQKSGDFEVEHFDSLNDFINTINRRETTENFAKLYSNIERCCSHRNTQEFSGSRDWNEANGLLRNGYPDGAKAMLDEGRGINVQSVSNRRHVVIDRVGCQAHVPNAIIGLPKTMIRRVNEQKKTKAISIWYDCTASARVDAETLFIGGRNIYAIIQYLEKKGYRVELRCLIVESNERRRTTNGDKKHYQHVGMMSIKIKDYQQAINPLMISYPVTHPSFFRRHGFRWIETSPCTKYSEYIYGYGLPYINYCRSRSIDVGDQLRKASVIPETAKYISSVAAAGARNVDDMLRLMKIAA